MYIWHVIFGEPLELPRRQHDPNVPLFMRVQNIEIEFLQEEVDGGKAEILEHHHHPSGLDTYDQMNILFSAGPE